MRSGGESKPAGNLSLRVIRRSTDSAMADADRLLRAIERRWPRSDSMGSILANGFPSREPITGDRRVDAEINEWRLRNVRNLWRGLRRVIPARLFGVPTHYGALWVTVLRADGTEIPMGLASLRVVTDTGVGFIVDAFQNSVELETMKYHGLGTGTTAESASQTALVTELSTQYSPDSTRATGTTTEASSNVYRTVGTNTLDGSAAVTEHGIFSAATAGTGVLLDRSVFSALNLVSGDGLSTTYDLTFSSGG